MLILRVGLYLAVIAAAYVVWASSSAGFSIEVAMLRGLLAAMGVAFVAYLAELVVLTAPVDAKRQQQAASDAALADDAPPNDPVNLPAVRAERSAAADKRRAA